MVNISMDYSGTSPSTSDKIKKIHYFFLLAKTSLFRVSNHPSLIETIPLSPPQNPLL